LEPLRESAARPPGLGSLGGGWGVGVLGG